MKYKGYNIYSENDSVIVSDVRDFVPAHIFNCGQTFRWRMEQDGTYTGVVHGRVINVGMTERDVVIKNTNVDEFKNLWFEYFDLERDYGQIMERIRKDNNINKACEFGHGIRILKQDFYEMLISFIISANNRIPMIMKTIEKLSDMFGSKINYEGKTYNKFPELRSIAESSIELISESRMGFRAKYVRNTAQKIMEKGIVEAELKKMNTQSVIKELSTLDGVGNKVAQCVMLFSGIKHDVFPTDVWVKRVMEELYFDGKETTIQKILEFAREYFGEDQGFAQQYLFYYARENRIGC